MTRIAFAPTLALFAALATSGSQAALVSRAGGTMVYDTDLNITWLADANLFKTQASANPGLVSSIIATVGSVQTEAGPHTLTVNDFNTATGRMTWWGAMAWAAQLDFGGATQWRLPSHPCTSWAAGCTVYGVNQPSSEMGHLFYSELGGVAFQAISAQHNANYDLFTNVQDWMYASGQEGTFPFNPPGAYVTSFSNGDQYATFQYVDQMHAWAVHDGDIGAVTAVPEPGTLALLAAGLAVVGTTASRRRRTRQG